MAAMRDTDTSDDIIRRLVAWAEGQTTLRAMLLTSTRAIPGAAIDALSDYDVVLVAYWDPVTIDPDTGVAQSGNIVQYDCDLKIDFTLWPVALLERISRLPKLPAELDAGYRVLVDKDRLAGSLSAPTSTGYIPAPPDEATYKTVVNDFFIGVPYVAKCLLRDELLPAKWCLDYDMRYVYLLPVLEWRMECDHCWSATTGALGKGLKRRPPSAIWTEMEGTFAGASIADTSATPTPRNWTGGSPPMRDACEVAHLARR